MSNVSRMHSQHRPAAGRPRAQRGFTLLELVTTVTVAGILLTVAVPSFFNTQRNSHAAADANELVSSLSIARSEAIRRASRITVCRSSDGTSCSGTWAQGWIVFRDSAASDTAAPSLAAASDILRVSLAPTGNPAITTTPNGTTWIRFLPRGYTRSSTSIPTTFNIAVYGCTGQQARTVEVNAVGRATAATAACP